MTYNTKNAVILVGGFHEIIELCEICGKKIIGLIDGDLGKRYYNYEVFGEDSVAFDIYKEVGDVPLIISPDSPEVRKRLVNYYSNIGFNFCSLIHPNATISKYANIGKGVIVQSGAFVSANVVVQDFAKINVSGCVMHDSFIGKYTTIAPNAVVLGRVKIFESCYIGANSTVLPERAIGERATVGAGSVVTKDVPQDITVVGVPARQMLRHHRYD